MPSFQHFELLNTCYPSPRSYSTRVSGCVLTDKVLWLLIRQDVCLQPNIGRNCYVLHCDEGQFVQVRRTGSRQTQDLVMPSPTWSRSAEARICTQPCNL
jgi:hypothetical protein